MADEVMFLREHPEDNPHAGSKARNDVEAVLEQLGLQSMGQLAPFPYQQLWRKVLCLCAPSYLGKLAHLLSVQGRTICLQYPFYFDRVTRRVLEQVVRRNRTILIVHDVDAWRGLGDSWEHIKPIFDCARLLIVHNEKMKARLQAEGVTTPMLCLGVFDYLLPEPLPQVERHRAPELSFAGNLSKSTFLHTEAMAQLPLTMHLYGIGFSPESIRGTDIQYHGSYPPDRIPYELAGSFGLIWDGNGIDACSGTYGDYMRYNNPHKLSLYISAAMPVITWRQAAIADFIEREHIGFVVDSLTEVPERIASLTDAEYDAFMTNLRRLQLDVCHGQYMRRAVERALAMMQES